MSRTLLETLQEVNFLSIYCPYTFFATLFHLAAPHQKAVITDRNKILDKQRKTFCHSRWTSPDVPGQISCGFGQRRTPNKHSHFHPFRYYRHAEQPLLLHSHRGGGRYGGHLLYHRPADCTALGKPRPARTRVGSEAGLLFRIHCRPAACPSYRSAGWED